MTTTTLVRQAGDIAAPDRQHVRDVRRRPWRSSVVTGAVAAEGIALAILVAADGSPVWRLVRATLVAVACGAIVVQSRRRRSTWCPWCLLIEGVAGTAAGAAIGVPHAIVAPGSVRAISGITLLISGAIVLVTSAWILITRARGWRKLAALPVAFVLFQFALLPLGLALFATNRAPTEVGSLTPADFGLDYDDVLMPTRDGVVLSGWCIPSSTGAAVVLLHGSGETRSATLEHAVVLARHGYGALLLDARGHGRSQGVAMDHGWHGDADIEAALTYLTTRPDIDASRLALVGLSMGGEEAVGALGSDPRIRAAIAEGVTGRVAGDDAWMPRDLTGWVQRGTNAVMYQLDDLLSDAHPPMSLRVAVAAGAPRHVLLIASIGVPAEQWAAEYLEDASPSTVDVWVAPQAPHAQALQIQPQEWEERVTDFLNQHLNAGA